MSGMITRARVFATQALQVVNNVAKQQFVVSLNTVVDAVVVYEKDGKHITFVHTEVPREFRGKGVGKLLAQHVFTYALDNKLDVTCKCHFLAKYYQDNIDKYKSLKVILQLD